MRDEILKLKSEGRSHTEIVKILGCAISTVSYYCCPTTKTKMYERNRKNRKRWTIELKESFGSQCFICGYNKCLSSLHFHHKNKDKKGCVGNFIRNSPTKGMIEAKKCILICANCHGEIHEGITQIPP